MRVGVSLSIIRMPQSSTIRRFLWVILQQFPPLCGLLRPVLCALRCPLLLR